MAKKTNAPASGINKMGAVRQAMAELGNAATRTEIQKYIKDRTGVDMDLDVVSAYKSSISAQAKKSAAATPEPKPVAPQPTAAKAKARKPTRAKTAPKPVVPASTAPTVPRTGIALGDVHAVKALVGRLGVNTLKELVDVFGS